MALGVSNGTIFALQPRFLEAKTHTPCFSCYNLSKYVSVVFNSGYSLCLSIFSFLVFWFSWNYVSRKNLLFLVLDYANCLNLRNNGVCVDNAWKWAYYLFSDGLWTLFRRVLIWHKTKWLMQFYVLGLPSHSRPPL